LGVFGVERIPTLPTHPPPNRPTISVFARHEARRTLADGRAVATAVLRRMRQSAGRRLGVFGVERIPTLPTHPPPNRPTISVFARHEDCRTLADGRAVATAVLRRMRQSAGRRLGVFGVKRIPTLPTHPPPNRPTISVFARHEARRTLADGRAVATAVLRRTCSPPPFP